MALLQAMDRKELNRRQHLRQFMFEKVREEEIFELQHGSKGGDLSAYGDMEQLTHQHEKEQQRRQEQLLTSASARSAGLEADV